MGWPALSTGAYRLVCPVLFRLEPERIHRWTLAALRASSGIAPGRALIRVAAGRPPGTAGVMVAGLRLRNRIGLGAGFDKDGEAIRGWAALRLGFVELGTVTPAAQPGNPRPRLFRLPADGALVNRMGFNNRGAAALAERLARARASLPEGFIVGVNIGRGRDTPEASAIDDYLAAYRLLAALADYVALNVSSPNTPGLRSMQSPALLADLLGRLRGAGEELGGGPPLFVKLAPDLSTEEVLDLAPVVAAAGGRGLILANTTLRRDGLRSPAALGDQAGGLSGHPLLERTLELVGAVRAALGDRLAIVASGGIGSGADAAAAIRAGADLVQLWTGLVYRGPGLIGEAVAATA